jgi:peptidoglycan/xylan/chitin deacetylase (PgdA/CDA1 family)
MDEIYSRGADHYVLCGMSIDDKNSVSVDAIGAGLDRAQIDGTTLHLYAHQPTRTVEAATIEIVLASTADRGLGFATYRDLIDGEVPGSLALSFDDHDLVGWTALRPVFERYAARVTFFVSGFLDLDDEERAQLHQLAADGHDIQYHSTHHEHAAEYSAAHGVEAYLADDILPALEAMRADGFDPDVFAYPFGGRSAETDRALEPYFANLRAIRSSCPQ